MRPKRIADGTPSETWACAIASSGGEAELVPGGQERVDEAALFAEAHHVPGDAERACVGLAVRRRATWPRRTSG